MVGAPLGAEGSVGEVGVAPLVHSHRSFQTSAPAKSRNFEAAAANGIKSIGLRIASISDAVNVGIAGGSVLQNVANSQVSAPINPAATTAHGVGALLNNAPIAGGAM